MKMWNEHKDKLKSVLWSTFVHINMKTKKTESHSQNLLDTFKPFENTIDANINFDERVEQLRNS
jgi:hypothetical protein